MGLKFYRENTEEHNMVMITWSKTMRLFSLLTALVLLSACTACGVGHDVDKHYNFAPLSADVDPLIAERIRYQINNFNTLVGAQILTLGGNGGEYSTITVVDHLDANSAELAGESSTGARVTKYMGGRLGSFTQRTMAITLNAEYYRRHAKDDAPNIVFLHEVGHGLEMNHSNDPTDVMYPGPSSAAPDTRRFIEQAKTYLEIQ